MIRAMKVSLQQPLKVTTFRGTITDCESLVVGAVVGPEGQLIQAFGDPKFRTSPRSTFKPFQALPYFKSGAFEAEGSRLERLALACSSHLGEDLHFKILEPWMQELGLMEQALACGTQSGRAPHRLRNNCSGKHLGLIAASQKLGLDGSTYNQEKSPLQTMIRELLQVFFNEDFSTAGVGTDGCSLPVYDCRIESLALAWWRLLISPPPQFKSECQMIKQAMAEYPILVEGTGSVTSELIAASKGDLIVKGGAAGVYTGASISKKIGFAFKCVDGQMDPTKETLFYFLRQQNLMSAQVLEKVHLKTFGPPHNWAGETTGHREIK